MSPRAYINMHYLKSVSLPSVIISSPHPSHLLYQYVLKRHTVGVIVLCVLSRIHLILWVQGGVVLEP